MVRPKSRLKSLDLSSGRYVDLHHLFEGPDQPEYQFRAQHPGFPCLQELSLCGTHLGQVSMDCIRKAVQVGKLPQLKDLHLSENTLTRCLTVLLGGQDHPRFSCLEQLNLCNTYLDQEDVVCLSEAVRAGQLPVLKKLHLRRNNLRYMGREVLALVIVCEADCQKGMKLNLFDIGLSLEFRDKCRGKVRNIHLMI